MTVVLGFEGTLDGALVSYGAAAIAVGDKHVRNSVSGLTVEIEPNTFDSVTKFRTVLAIEDTYEKAPVIVLALDRSTSAIEPLVPDTGRLGGFVTTKREKPYVFYLFQDRQAFAQYCEEAVWSVTEALLQGEVEEVDILQLIRSCLVLAPRDPVLLALRIHWSADKDATRKTAERLLTPEGRISLRTYLRALGQPQDAEYLIKYDRGIAGTGGLDLEVAVRQLGALHGLHEKLEPELRRRLPFIGENGSIPELRFQTLRAASAQLGFGVRGNTLRERVIRFFELELIAEIVAGKLPQDVAKDPEFRQGLEALLAPPDTVVLHQPIGAPELEPIEREVLVQPEESVVRQDSARVLGFVEGMFRRVRRAELRIGVNHLITVPTEDDGYGLVPMGADVLRMGRGGYFLPTVFSLTRRLYSSGRSTWFMQRMNILQESHQADVDTFPSSIIEKALFKVGDCRVSYDGHVLSVDGLGEAHVVGVGLDAATGWLTQLQSLAIVAELKATASPDTVWLPPAPFPQATAVRRIIAVLGTVDHETRLPELVSMLNDRFSTRVRINNTMRELRDHKDLFEVDEDMVKLTDTGRAWYAAMRGYETADARASLPLFARGD